MKHPTGATERWLAKSRGVRIGRREVFKRATILGIAGSPIAPMLDAVRLDRMRAAGGVATLSLKQALMSRYPEIDLRKGVMESLLSDVANAFYGTHPSRFPYRGGLRFLLKSLEWPQSYEFVNDYPKESNPGWHSNVQGVTNDGEHWFITQRDKLWKIPAGHNLKHHVGDSPSILSIGIPFQRILGENVSESEGLRKYNHFGGLDYYDGRLYVPLEATGKNLIPLIVAFNSDNLEYVEHWELRGQAHDNTAPWCAINPLNGLLYSSSDSINSDKGHLRVYTLEHKYLGKFELRDTSDGVLKADGIQGGVFSKLGHLYLVSWDREDVKNGGILGFDMVTGRKIVHILAEYDPTERSPEELEGMTLWDLDSGEAPGIQGQIHLLMLDNEFWTTDDVYFKHFRVPEEDKEKI